ncbi:Uncharacterized protein TCAP_04452 [Tolypocladium capitatum]|uniref:Uncharacterized protein n=1 Tax=Tolypocladium capitatum TaxID=45235 RepID=A0A2K3QDI0_9HYPO|nr:Uncharacterized protein TCAP_04452 [Tolypocladium capitatum]
MPLEEDKMPANWTEQPQESDAKIHMAAFEEKMKAYRAQDRLEEIDKELNNEHLKPDAPWGLAVYRTCYDDEVGWQKMREHLETRVRESLEYYVNDGMLQRHRFVFMDDKTQFDGASPAKVRDHFEQWAKEELARNWAAQPVTEEMRHDMYGPPDNPDNGALSWAGTRYHVCVLIDDVCLLSLDENRVGPIFMLVNKDFGIPHEITEDNEHPDYEDGWMVDHNEGPGGWIYVRSSEYVETYNALHDRNEWGEDDRFMYPSMVYGDMGLERSPAFWREEVAAKKG